MPQRCWTESVSVYSYKFFSTKLVASTLELQPAVTNYTHLSDVLSVPLFYRCDDTSNLLSVLDFLRENLSSLHHVKRAAPPSRKLRPASL